MSVSEKIFTAMKDVVLLTSKVEGLTDDCKELSNTVNSIDRRLIKVETKFETYKEIAQLTKS